MLARAALQTAHGLQAARGRWVLNEKDLLGRAGLTAADEVLQNAGDVVTAASRMRELLDPAGVEGLRR